MNFLSPGFLFGLFALPIPFIIHLWHQHRLKKIWFPSISLITQAKRGEKAFRKLKDIILLVLRTLGLLFLVFAFANPVVLRRQKIAILDDSWDMFTKSGNQTVFDKAEKVALSLKNTKILLGSGKPYPSPCKYQKFYLPTSQVDYIITKAGKLPLKGEGNTPSPLRTPLPRDVKLIEIEYERDNFSVDSLSYTPSSFIAFIRNHTPQEKSRLIVLSFDTKRFETRISIPPYTTAAAIFPPLLIGKSGDSSLVGSVRIEEKDALALDNVRYFVYSPLPSLKVLIVGNSDDAFFLQNALSPEGGKSSISVEVSPKLINPTAYDVIILFQDYKITRLQDYKKVITIPVDAPEVEGMLTLAISETHPIFVGLRSNLFEFMNELKEIKFTHRRAMDSGKGGVPTKVIASFSDGSPAIVEHSSGALEFLFPISLQSKDFILSPLFPLLMWRIVYWVAGKPIEKHNFTVGETVQFRVPEFKTYQCINVMPQYNVGAQYIEPLLPKIEPTGIYIYFTPSAPGIYKISGASKEVLPQFAVNISNSLVYPPVGVQKFEPLQSQVSIKRWFFLFVLVLLTAELIIRRR